MTLPQQSSQQQSQHFLLKWNNHRSNMVNVFESLFQSENLVDVTIAVEGKFLKAHKIVLSACSPYFQAMFVNHTPSEKYPILVFHDMKFAHLKTLLDFMYRGEISIDEKDLGEVLKVAEALSIRGLSSFESDDEESEKSEPCQNQNQNQNNNNSNNNNNNNNSNAENHSNTNESSSTNNNATTSSSSTTTTSASNSNTTAGRGGKNSSSHFTKSNGKSSPTNHGKCVSSSTSSSSSSSGTGANDNHNPAFSSTSSQNNGCDSSLSSNCNEKSSGAGSVKASKFLNTERPNSSHNSSEEPKPLISAPLPVKKKRGRQPKNKSPAVVEPPLPVQALKTPSSSKLQARFPELKTPVPRQGVRRRLPRRFPGVPTRLKRVKLSKRDDDDEMFVAGAEGILTDLADGPDCEPLSEMSVRGLDLFKYASIEDGVYRCIECEKLRIPKTFKNKYSFQRHAFLYHEGNMRKVFPCPVCSREFSRPDKMKNHLRSIHEGRNSRVSNNSGDDSPENVIITKSEGNESCDV